MAKALRLSTYNPDFNDPRVRERATAVLKWCDELRLSKRPRRIHRDTLFEVFGNTSRGLGLWLRSNLLMQLDTYAVGQKSYSYQLRQEGYEKIYARLNATPPTDVQVVQERYADLIDGSAEIRYTDKGDRRYHPAQNIKREVRKQAFAGWWDYDIEACAATLVHQYAVQFCRRLKLETDAVEPLPAVAMSIHDKVAVRQHVAALTGLSEKEAKELIQMLLFRAIVSPHHKSSVFRKLKEDTNAYYRLISDPFITSFRAEVKRMWGWALLHDRREKLWQHLEGKAPGWQSRINSKARMAVYLKLERRVIDAVLDSLKQQGISVFLMHDGFMSKRRINVEALEQQVFAKTGFAIKLKEEQLGATSGDDEDPDPTDIMEDDPGEIDHIDDDPVEADN